LAPCIDAVIKAKIKRCFIGVAEPDDFVLCEGAQRLKEAGIEVVWLGGLEEECLDVARRKPEEKTQVDDYTPPASPTSPPCYLCKHKIAEAYFGMEGTEAF
jgi:hypothetical protein